MIWKHIIHAIFIIVLVQFFFLLLVRRRPPSSYSSAMIRVEEIFLASEPRSYEANVCAHGVLVIRK